MKIQSPSLLLLLLPALSTAATNTKSISEPSAHPSRGASTLDARYIDADSVASTNAIHGSPDVHGDGKDGRPHAGPWVETSAERDRKSSQGSDDVDLVSTKYDSKIPSSDHLSTEEGKMIPHSNGGVMDDPHRAGPQEGTRGTEGGVSEKGKENLYNAAKTPDSPKEALPLPPSEKQKMPSDGEDATSGSRTAEGAGTLGMLEVRLIILWGVTSSNTDAISRNPPTYPRSRTISLTPNPHPRPRTILCLSNMAPVQAHTPAHHQQRAQAPPRGAMGSTL